jgi:N-acetylneuraminic acid mutarotase
MPFPRIDHGTATVGGKIYAIGGFTGQTVRHADQYDPETDTWTRKADMPTARRCFALGAIQGKVYVTGGMNFTDPNNVTYVYATEAYDPLSDSWSTLSDFPMTAPVNNILGNAFIAGATAMDKLYVAVFSVSEAGKTALYEYDPQANAWARKASPPLLGEFEDLSAVECQGKIYVFCSGGLAEYTPEEDLWIRRQSAATERQSGSLCVFNNLIYAFGGVDSMGGIVDEVEEYDPLTDSWGTPGRMKSPRAYLSAVSTESSIYATGGSFSSGRFSPVPLDLVEEAQIVSRGR